MSRFLFAILLFGCGTIHAQQKSSLVIKTSPDKELLYWFSGMDYLSDYEQGYARSEKAKTDSTGFLFKEFSLDKPVTLNLAKMVKTIMSVLSVYLTPGSQDTIVIMDNQITFQGTNADYNRCLLETETFLDYCSQLLIMKPSKDLLFQTKSYPEFINLLEERRKEVETKVKQYPGLNTDFAEEQLSHIDLGSRMAIMYKILANVPDSLQTEDWKQAAKEIINNTINIPYLPSFRQGYFVLNGFLILDYKAEHGNMEGLTKSSFETFERLGRFLKGNNLEYAWATFINDDISYKTFNPIVPELYELLKERFPENTYKSFLEAGIQENNSFNAIKATDASNLDYQILPCDSSFLSLSDAVKSLKGKVVYVDLWATWCGSCLSEFPYLPRIKDKTKDMDIAFLYISLDKPENKVRWEKSIRHYKLKGYHLLATPALAEVIRKEFGNYIPHFAIIDKEGKVVERNAPAPKQTDVLYEKLLQWCK